LFDLLVLSRKLKPLVLRLENLLQTHPRLDVDDVNLAIVRSEVRLAMAFVLADAYAAHVLILKHRLVQHHQLSVETRVDLQVGCGLHENRAEELVVESLDRHLSINQLAQVLLALV